MIRAKVVILLALAVIVIGIVVFRAAALHESTQDSPMTRQSPTGRPSSGQDTTTMDEDEAAGEVHSHEHLSSTTETARRQWAPVIDGFARNFTATNVSPGVWRTRLNAFSTVDVQRHLNSVDPAKVPLGRYTGFEVLEYQDHQLAAKVTYAEGWAMVLYLVDEVSVWRIHRYDRFEE